MRLLRRIVLPASLLFVPFMTVCVFSLGGGKTETVVRRTTGEELTDLKAALDSGAVTPEEYDRLKQQISQENIRVFWLSALWRLA